MDIWYIFAFFVFSAVFLFLGAWRRNQLAFFIGSVFLAFCGLFLLGSGIQFATGVNTTYSPGYSLYVNNTAFCNNSNVTLGWGCDSNVSISGSTEVSTVYTDLNKDYSMGLSVVLLLVSFYLGYLAMQSWRYDEQV